MPKSRGRKPKTREARANSAEGKGGSSRAAAIFFGLAVAGNLLNVAGLTDGLIKWRDFFRDGLLLPYQKLKETLFAILPVKVPESFHDLIISCAFILALQRSLWGLTPIERRAQFLQALGPLRFLYALMIFGFTPIATSHILDAFTKKEYIQAWRENGFFSLKNAALLGAIQLVMIAITLWNAEVLSKGKNRQIIHRQHQEMLRAYLIFVAAFLALLFIAADLPRLFM